MSAADNSSNLSNSSTDVNEDELLTWLQYPVDDTFDRNYCSDLFGGSLSSPKAAVLKARTAVNSLAGSLSDVRTSTCTVSGSTRLPDKKNVGTKSFSRSSSSAEDALARGAARAAGHSLQVGHDAFNKVRTSVQAQAMRTSFLPQAMITTPCSSLKAFNHQDCLVHMPKMPVPHANSRPPHEGRMESPSLHMASSFFTERTKHPPTASISPATENARKAIKETHSQQQSNTRQSRSSHITEEDSVAKVYGKDVSSGNSTAPRTGTARVKAAMMTSSNSWDMKGKMGWADQTSETPTSYSGGSQTSMSLCFRDQMTYGGKRKHEDSELQIEDADDKMRNIKVPCTSLSRRNRVPEVHNLSERNRRNRINEKLKALQDLIPNSSKTDKASVLDEAIEYMKTLQTQLQMVSMRNSMNMTPMMMPMTFPLTPMHLAPLHSIGLGVPIGHAAMGMGVGADLQLTPQGHFSSSPSSVTNYGMPFRSGSIVSLQDNNHACTNVGLLSTHPLASMQKNHEPSEHIHPRLISTLYTQQCQQQEQGQQLGYPIFNHEHEQQDGLSD